KFKPNTDVSITLTKGALTLSTITPDPLCAGGSYRLAFPVADNGPSKLVLIASGRAELSLELLADPLSLAGCSLPASPAKTTLTVAGNVGPEGLVKLAISGTVAGIPIAPDVTGTVTMNLLVKVDLSGRA